MTATNKTTIQPITFGYRAVGSAEAVEYTEVGGFLNDQALSQDNADETNITGQGKTSPFAIIREGKPLKMTATLVNYKLSDLPALFGGTYTAAAAGVQESYVDAGNDFSSEWEWKITYKKGNAALVILRGDTVGSVKQENKGALGYSITITALSVDGSTSSYKILGDPATT